MDAADFSDAVESAKRTQLDRLGSQQYLLALTDADLDSETVLARAAESERAAAETFDRWADDEGDERAAEAFASVAARERDHYDRVADELDADGDRFDAADAPGPVHDHLRGLADTVERVAAGLVGRGLVGSRSQLQLINFFVNEGDEVRADLFRDLRRETQGDVETGRDLLAHVCEGDGDWERARTAAEAVVQVAYDDYAATLEDMGLDPRPIC